MNISGTSPRWSPLSFPGFRFIWDRGKEALLFQTKGSRDLVFEKLILLWLRNEINTQLERADSHTETILEWLMDD